MAPRGKVIKVPILPTNILSSNLSPTDSDRLRWCLRFAPFASVMIPKIPSLTPEI